MRAGCSQLHPFSGNRLLVETKWPLPKNVWPMRVRGRANPLQPAHENAILGIRFFEFFLLPICVAGFVESLKTLQIAANPDLGVSPLGGGWPAPGALASTKRSFSKLYIKLQKWSETQNCPKCCKVFTDRPFGGVRRGSRFGLIATYFFRQPRRICKFRSEIVLSSRGNCDLAKPAL